VPTPPSALRNLTCPACGSVYPLEGVRGYERFQCAICGRIIEVPSATSPPPIPAGSAARPERPRRAPRAVARAAAGPDMLARDGDPRRMRPIAAFSNAVTALAVFVVLAGVFDALARWRQIDYLVELSNGRAADVERAVALDRSALETGFGLSALLLVHLTVFVAWFHRAHSNLVHAELPKLEYASWWTIGGFFVPVLQLFRPAQVMTETWKGTSYFAGLGRSTSWQSAPTTPTIATWWGAWLVALLLFAVPVWFPIGDPLTLATVILAQRMTTVITTLVGLTLVRQISDLQEWARRSARQRDEAT
jgi:hypothetical protein